MIGILAGMGPKSTGPFIDKVVEQCQLIYNAKYDIDFPQMMIYSCPTPFYIDRPIIHSDLEKSIIEGAQKLERTNVNFIAIPCNTAHLYFNKIQSSLSVPVINMIEETLKELPINARNIAVLATESVINSGLYQDSLMQYGLNCIQENKWQYYVNELIVQIKSGNLDCGIKLWDRIFYELTNKVDAVIVACTDLNVISDKSKHDICLIDSSTCLARAIVNKYITENK
ncbi:amino-acid racemase [Saccharibacillus sp. O16]|nr:amino-acid racemase [Saccharibacillus sp. O16]